IINRDTACPLPCHDAANTPASFTGPRPAVTALGQISGSPVKPHNCPHSSAHPAAHSKPASPPADAPHRLILNHAQHSRHSNPHSARRTALVSLPAVSSLGGFPTPAAHARATPPSAAGIRKPSQTQTFTARERREGGGAYLPSFQISCA